MPWAEHALYQALFVASALWAGERAAAHEPAELLLRPGAVRGGIAPVDVVNRQSQVERQRIRRGRRRATHRAEQRVFAALHAAFVCVATETFAVMNWKY